MKKAARIKRDEKIDELLYEGWSVPIIAQTVNLSERTIYSRKAASHKAEVENDPLLAELEVALAELDRDFPMPELPPLTSVLDMLERYSGS